MADTSEASEAARALVAARWGPPGSRELDRAVETVAQRAAQLTADHRAKIEAAIGGGSDDDGNR